MEGLTRVAYSAESHGDGVRGVHVPECGERRE